MEKITCTIKHITYQNPENGYAVLQASVICVLSVQDSM